MGFNCSTHSVDTHYLEHSTVKVASRPTVGPTQYYARTASVTWADRLRGTTLKEEDEWTAQDGVDFVSPREKAVQGVSHLNRERGPRTTLCTWKLYLDSCATYHLVFVDWCRDNFKTVGVSLTD